MRYPLYHPLQASRRRSVVVAPPCRSKSSLRSRRQLNLRHRQNAHRPGTARCLPGRRLIFALRLGGRAEHLCVLRNEFKILLRGRVLRRGTRGATLLPLWVLLHRRVQESLQQDQVSSCHVHLNSERSSENPTLSSSASFRTLFRTRSSTSCTCSPLSCCLDPTRELDRTDEPGRQDAEGTRHCFCRRRLGGSIVFLRLPAHATRISRKHSTSFCKDVWGAVVAPEVTTPHGVSSSFFLHLPASSSRLVSPFSLSSLYPTVVDVADLVSLFWFPFLFAANPSLLLDIPLPKKFVPKKNVLVL